MKTGYTTGVRFRSWTTILVLAILAIGMGGALYVFLRIEDPLFLQWLSEWLNRPDPGLGGHLFQSGRGILPDWMLYSLPSGLWAFAYSMLITRIWYGHPHPARYIWFLSIPILVFGFEFFQLWGIIPGRYCPIDLIFSVSGILSGSLIPQKWSKPKQTYRYETKVTTSPN